MAETERRKDEIRAAMKARRKAVTPEARKAAGRALSQRLFVTDRNLGRAITKKGPIAVYLASKDEIDLADFIVAALSFGCTLVAPRWNGTEYELVRVEGLETLVKGPHGIFEPPAGTVVRPKDVRAWLVPGLAFTRKGGRLGYGGGWYDRLLREVPKRVLKIGVAYTFQLVDELPTEPHDIRLTSVACCDDLADVKPLIVPPEEVGRKQSFWTLKWEPDSRVADAAHALLEARPYTWGVGLWSSVEVEAIAKRCAEILTDAYQSSVANLIPKDTIGGINRLERFGDLGDVEALIEIEREFRCEIPEDKLRPELTFAEFVELVRTGRGKAVRTEKPHGPIYRIFAAMWRWGGQWAVFACLCGLPVVLPLDMFRRYRATGYLTGGIHVEMIVLAMMICGVIDACCKPSNGKLRRHWEALFESPRQKGRSESIR